MAEPTFKAFSARGWLATGIAMGAALTLTGGPVLAAKKDFTFSEKANDRLAKKLNIPIYFAVPSSTRAAAPKDRSRPPTSWSTSSTRTPSRPAATQAFVSWSRRAPACRRASAKSGIVQTGDLLLTFRAEWGGAGAYPNVQMGISHTGVAYMKDGKVYNIG